MMKKLIPLLLLMTGAATAATPPAKPLACNMNALTTEQRQRYKTLVTRLQASQPKPRELANGYELTIDAKRIALTELAEWIDLESRCCPFLTFALELEGGASTLRLRLTGGEGVREFLKVELFS